MRGLQGAFADNWLEATGEVLTGSAYLPDLEPMNGGGPMQVVRSAAGVGDTDVERAGAVAETGPRRIDAQLMAALERVQAVLSS